MSRKRPAKAELSAIRDAAMRAMQARGELLETSQGQRIVLAAGALRLVLRHPIHQPPAPGGGWLAPRAPESRPYRLTVMAGGAAVAVLAWGNEAAVVAARWVPGDWAAAVLALPTAPLPAKAGARQRR